MVYDSFISFVEVLFIFNVFISAVDQSDSVICVYSFHYGLPQDIEYCSLCYTVGLCCLSILYIIVCIC